MKTCKGCFATQDENAFGKDRTHEDGLSSKCKVCRKARQNQSSRECLWKRLGILNRRGTQFLQVDYNWLFAEQLGQCRICSLPQEKLVCLLHIDHDHRTKVARGLLCENCNRGIGCLKDSALFLSRAAEYLKEMSNGTVAVH